MKIFGIVISLLAGALNLSAKQPSPTYNNLRYSTGYERSTMDLWLPDGDEPAPLIVVFHGGSFRGGNKEDHMPYRRQLLPLLKEGVAVASVGYPLIGDQGEGDVIGQMDYHKILRETAKSIRYLQDHAGELGLDAKRFVVGGISAGAIIAEYLTYAEPLGITVCLGLEQPYAVQFVVGVIEKGEAPLILCTFSSEDDRTHHPSYARTLKEHCDRVGVTCFLYGNGRNGLPAIPDEQALIPRAMEIVRAVWAGELE